MALQGQRLKCAELEGELNEMKAELHKSSIELDNELGNGLTKIFECSDKNVKPFNMSLFWQQQKKLFQSSPTAVRFHPMIIQFCLSLTAKSPSCYKELRTGVS